MAHSLTSNIGIRHVLGITALGVAADLFFNSGHIIKTLMPGIFGKATPATTHKNQIKYQLIPHRFNTDGNQDEDLKRALIRLQNNFPNEYQNFLTKEKLFTEDKVLGHFKYEFSKGTCSGIVNALFDKIHKKESLSLKESVSLLNYEDIFYHHALQKLCVKKDGLDFCSEIQLFQKKIELNERNVEIIKKSMSSGTPPPAIQVKSDEEWEQVKKQIRNQLEKDLKHIGKDYHSSTFPESSKFLVLADSSTYRNALQEVADQFPGHDDYVGCMHIQNHLIGFQFGKSGYYLYDSIDGNKGLFEYPDLQTFVHELKKHAVDDVIYGKGVLVQERNPNISSTELNAKTEEMLSKAKGYFGIRPISQINDMAQS
ncbi:MAG: hypothetical protein JSS60_07835 [Verrucomicrobia bacterium]|nr:hypothetical protein [Verrucomicrobiota bacterium]